jgi:hypothetical protein
MTESFDVISQNMAEAIDDVLTVTRDRQRRIELIRHQVRRALSLGYKAARKVDIPAEGDGR